MSLVPLSIAQTSVTLTNAQIKALPTTPIVLAAAPPAGFLIQPLLATLFAKTASGAYTNIDAAGSLNVAADIFALGYVPNDVAITTGSATRLTDLLGGTGNKTVNLTPYVDTESMDGWGNVGVVGSTPAPTALTIAIDNGGSGVLTGGNAANTLTVIVLYVVIPIP